MASTSWGTDTLISMPEPPSRDQPALVDLGGGFVFTAGGIAHNLTTADAEELLTPTFMPPDINLRDDGGRG